MRIKGWGIWVLLFILGNVLLQPFFAPDHAHSSLYSLAYQSPFFECPAWKVPRSTMQTSQDPVWALAGLGSPRYDYYPYARFQKKGDSLLLWDWGREVSTAPAHTVLVMDKELWERSTNTTLFYPLGTDRFGRDLYSRVMSGGRISLLVGFLGAFLALTMGTLVGLLSGFFGGFRDSLLTWVMNVFWSLPAMLWAIALTLILGKGFWQVFIAVGLSLWVDVARIVRGQVMGLRQIEFVEAAKMSGMPSWTVMYKQILPNLYPLLMVLAALNFSTSVLLESGISFLGFGAQPPVPSWGNLIREHYAGVVLGKGYGAIIPGTLIFLVVWSMNDLAGSGRTLTVKDK